MKIKIFAQAAAAALVVFAAEHSYAGCGRVASASQFDSFYAPLWGCAQTNINDMWSRFAFDAADWGGDMGYSNVCDDSTPLKRTFNAMQLLAYGMTNAPTCSTSSSNVGMWAYCWAGDNIDEIYPTCETGGTRAKTQFGTFVDNYTKLYQPFFYDETVVHRAGTLFHEARHANGWCSHTSTCADGGDSCDPNFSSGCVGTGSGSGPGANGYTVLYMNWFATTARSNWINTAIRANAVSEGNYYLTRRFGTDPCFRMNSAGYTFKTC